MNSRKKQIQLLFLLILILFAINYNFIDRTLENFLETKETAFVSRVIDGDTIEVLIGEKKESVRLLGINTPERGEVLYEEAKKFLEELSLNKSVRLEFGRDKYDRYNRTLAYVF